MSINRFYNLGSYSIDLEKFCRAEINVKMVIVDTIEYPEFSICVYTSEGCCGKRYVQAYKLETTSKYVTKHLDDLINAANAYTLQKS